MSSHVKKVKNIMFTREECVVKQKSPKISIRCKFIETASILMYKNTHLETIPLCYNEKIVQ